MTKNQKARIEEMLLKYNASMAKHIQIEHEASSAGAESLAALHHEQARVDGAIFYGITEALRALGYDRVWVDDDAIEIRKYAS